MHVNTGQWDEVPGPLLERAVRVVLDAEGVLVGEISITILDDVHIRRMNRDYLDHDWPTDVLSFELYGSGEPVLGDIYVGVEQAERQAAEREIPVIEELVRLVVHGTLHVLGYDHPDDPEREGSELFRKQERLVETLLA